MFIVRQYNFTHPHTIRARAHRVMLRSTRTVIASIGDDVYTRNQFE